MKKPFLTYLNCAIVACSLLLNFGCASVKNKATAPIPNTLDMWNLNGPVKNFTLKFYTQPPNSESRILLTTTSFFINKNGYVDSTYTIVDDTIVEKSFYNFTNGYFKGQSNFNKTGDFNEYIKVTKYNPDGTPKKGTYYNDSACTQPKGKAIYSVFNSADTLEYLAVYDSTKKVFESFVYTKMKDGKQLTFMQFYESSLNKPFLFRRIIKQRDEHNWTEAKMVGIDNDVSLFFVKAFEYY